MLFKFLPQILVVFKHPKRPLVKALCRAIARMAQARRRTVTMADSGVVTVRHTSQNLVLD